MALVKATLTNISTDDDSDPIEVQFNPTEYSMTRGASYAEVAVPGLSVPLLQFVRGETQTLNMELFLDGSDARQSVASALDDLRSFVEIDEDLHAPPVCEFQWGDTLFQGVVTTLNEKFVLFGESGEILRARVTVTMKSYVPPEVQARTLNRQSPDREKTRVVKEGDRLDFIAFEEYGDASLWRVIARRNNLARPRILTPGLVLEIPAI